MKNTLFLLLLLSSYSVYSQDLENISPLITDRPDQTESASIVDLSKIQLETGFNYSRFENFNTVDVLSTLLRVPIFQNMESRFTTGFIANHSLSDGMPDTEHSGFGPFSLGVKWLMKKESKQLPQIAAMGTFTLPWIGNEHFTPEHLTTEIRLLLSKDLGSIGLGVNVGFTLDGDEYVGFLYSLALGTNVTEKLGVFVEAFGDVENNNVLASFDGGLTLLLQSNMQLDFSTGFGIGENELKSFVGIGFSVIF